MVSLTTHGVIAPPLASYMAGIRALSIVSAGAETYLLAASGAGGGMTSLSLGAGRLAVIADQQGVAGSTTALSGMALGQLAGANSSLLLQANGAGLSRISLGAGGDLVQGATMAGPGAASAMASVETGGDGRFLYAAQGDALQAWRVGGDLGLTALPGTALAGLGMGQVSAMQALRVAGVDYLMMASASADEITAWRVDPASGALTPVAAMGAIEGLGLSKPSALAQANLAGVSYLLVAGAESNSISVIAVQPGGQMRPTDHVLDTLDTRFEGVTALASTMVNGQCLVLAAGGADDGLSLFTLLPGGRLVHLQSLADRADLALAHVSALALAQVGDELQVFAASSQETGLTQLRLPLAQLGSVQIAAAGGGVLGGGSLDDQLIGGLGNDSLSGGAGSDILADGGGSDRMQGGGGADIFVLAADGKRDTITDFEAGIDRLDLGNWWMLHSTGQLGYQPTVTGALLSYRDEILELISASGRSLTLAEIFPGGIRGEDHPPLVLNEASVAPGTAGDDRIIGSDWADLIEGQGGNDQIFGMGGDDTIAGGAGQDSLEGGAGRDQMDGGAGNDTLLGGADDDLLIGGTGADLAYLGDGQDRFEAGDSGAGALADTVWGGFGNDVIMGGGGGDQLYGEDGEDSIEGGAGNDLLFGGAGYDTLRGGDGDDQIWGGDGRDLVFLGNGNDLFTDGTQEGDKGIDTVRGGPGNDTILGRGGNDLLYGEAEDDLIEGGTGDDQIWGGTGFDTIRAGDGNDTVWGENGRDLVMLGKGDDVFFDSAQNDRNGNDTVWGFDGNDQLWGGGGNERFFGEAGDDTLTGGLADDWLDGGIGRDRLRGDLGNDTLTGGADADVFQFAPGMGQDRITDFHQGEDIVQFTGLAGGFGALTISYADGLALVSYEGGTITFDDIAPGGLQLSDFQFL